MNQVCLIGRLTRDPELRQTQSGKAVCNFTLAVDREFKTDDGPTADFFPVIVWGKSAENCARYLAKGRQVGVTGRLEVEEYTTKDGQKRRAPRITASRVDFLGGKQDREKQDGGDILDGAREMFFEQSDLPF